MRIRQVGADAKRRTERQTDAMKLIVAFRGFAKAPKTSSYGEENT